jgi:hypothetical protein
VRSGKLVNSALNCGNCFPSGGCNAEIAFLVGYRGVVVCDPSQLRQHLDIGNFPERVRGGHPNMRILVDKRLHEHLNAFPIPIFTKCTGGSLTEIDVLA